MIKAFLLSVGAASLIAGAAQAKPLTLTWTGLIAPENGAGSGIDTFGLFGDAGATVSGAAFTVVYKFDTEAGAVYRDGGQAAGYGGTYYPNIPPIPTPLVYDARITINGHTVLLDGAFYALITSVREDFSMFAAAAETNHDLRVRSVSNSLGSAGQYLWADPDFGSFDGDVSFASDPENNAFVQSDYMTFRFEVLRFNNSHLTIAQGVPEPSSWTLMLGGFGLVGGLLRLRRGSVASATLAIRRA